MVENRRTNGQLADIWGVLYQTEDDPVKKQSFMEDQDMDLVPGLEEDIGTALSAFHGDKGIEDQAGIRELLIATAKHESGGGRHLSQFGGGPARGAFQVEPETARNILKTSGLMGPKFYRLVNKTPAEIRGMPPREFADWLKNGKVSASFAIAKYLQAADAYGRLGDLQ